jgi:hypothetical protein
MTCAVNIIILAGNGDDGSGRVDGNCARSTPSHALLACTNSTPGGGSRWPGLGARPFTEQDGVKQPDPTHALTNDQGGATTRPCYAHAVQRRIFLAQPRQRPLPVASDERGLAQIAAFGPWRDLPHHTFCPGRPVKAVPPPCVPQTADCGAHVHCGTRSSCTPMAPMSESSWVLCGHGPASTPPCPHTRNSQGQAVPGYLTQAAPAPSTPFHTRTSRTASSLISHTHSPSSPPLLPWIGIHCYESTSLRLLIVALLPLEAARSFGLSLHQLATATPRRNNRRSARFTRALKTTFFSSN